MLRIASFLLLAACALAAQRAPYNGIHSHIRPQNNAGSGYPMDFEDDLIIKNPLIHPDTNILHSFSQARIDQPPLVDTREEKLGKYMLRRQPTTTTTTTPAPPKITPEASQSEDSEESVESSVDSIEKQPARNQQAEARTSKPVMLPTGTTSQVLIPSFRDFDTDLDIPDSSKINYASRYPSVDLWPRYTTTTTTTTPRVHNYHSQKIEMPAITTQKNEPQPTEHLSVVVVDEESEKIVTSGSVEPVTMQPATHRRKHKSHRGNRGGAKSWADAVQPAPSPSMAPAVPVVPAAASGSVQLLGPPPPVPTLTPWYGDDF